MTPVLSLVTGTLDRPQSFQRLYQSIRERTKVPWELVVSDASNPETKSYTTDLENVVSIREWPRAGCVKGYNKAFSQVRGKWVIWLNDDAEVMPGYDEAAIKYMEQHPECGLGALYYANLTLPFFIQTYHDMIYANFGIISKELGDQIGWMDDVVRMYGNDNSICFRVLLEGKGLGSIPGSRIWHHPFVDQQRKENVARQREDAEALMGKYRQALPFMREVYDRYLHLVGPIVLSEDY
jgi:GT2 family glycosyltransferase